MKVCTPSSLFHDHHHHTSPCVPVRLLRMTSPHPPLPPHLTSPHLTSPHYTTFTHFTILMLNHTIHPLSLINLETSPIHPHQYIVLDHMISNSYTTPLHITYYTSIYPTLRATSSIPHPRPLISIHIPYILHVPNHHTNVYTEQNIAGEKSHSHYSQASQQYFICS